MQNLNFIRFLLDLVEVVPSFSTILLKKEEDLVEVVNLRIRDTLHPVFSLDGHVLDPPRNISPLC